MTSTLPLRDDQTPDYSSRSFDQQLAHDRGYARRFPAVARLLNVACRELDLRFDDLKALWCFILSVINSRSTVLVLFWGRQRALLLLIVLNLALPFYFGLRGGGLLVPLVCSAAMTVNAILLGWRALMQGDFAAAPIGTTFASAMILPGIYFIGRWIGDAASGPMSFSVQELIAVVLVIGAAVLSENHIRTYW